MKESKFLMGTSILTIIVLLAGATFSYFNVSLESDESVAGFAAMSFSTSVEITALYNDKALVPLDDSDVMKAYNHNCVDDVGYGACQAYSIEIANDADKTSYDGTIKFTTNGIQNLKYLVLDENDNVYASSTGVVSETNQTLGDTFELDNGESKSFVLVVWLSNIDSNQNEYDAGGSFDALVTYTSAHGSRITGTFSVS